jgi:hypothetical protein
MFLVFLSAALFVHSCSASVLLIDDFNVNDGDLETTVPLIGTTWIRKDTDSNLQAAATQTTLKVLDGHVKTTHVSNKRHLGAGAGFTPADPGETLFVGFAVQVNTGSTDGCAEFVALFDGVTDSPLRVHFAITGTKVAFGLHPTRRCATPRPSAASSSRSSTNKSFLSSATTRRPALRVSS